MDVVRSLIAANPWATIVSYDGDGLVASHSPILLDDADGEQLSIVTHVGRPDEKVHQLGDDASRSQVIEELRGSGFSANPALADAMERARASR